MTRSKSKPKRAPAKKKKTQRESLRFTSPSGYLVDIPYPTLPTKPK